MPSIIKRFFSYLNIFCFLYSLVKCTLWSDNNLFSHNVDFYLCHILADVILVFIHMKMSVFKKKNTQYVPIFCSFQPLWCLWQSVICINISKYRIIEFEWFVIELISWSTNRIRWHQNTEHCFDSNKKILQTTFFVCHCSAFYK